MGGGGAERRAWRLTSLVPWGWNPGPLPGPHWYRCAAGNRAATGPVVIVASRGYLDTVTTLALVVPITTTDRGWPNHIRLTGDVGLDVPCWAMTEQLRTISCTRLTRVSGQLSEGCLRDIRTWLADFLDLFTG